MVPARTVLGVIHNVTSATRLLDLLTVFDGDPRVQVLFTCTGSSPFEPGIEEFVGARELPFISWEEARSYAFDLAVSASRGGDLQDISAPIIGTPHGAGYNKTLQREPGAGSREPGAGSREPGAGSQEPGARSQEPGAGSREPGAGSREPGAGSREPGAGSQEPGARSQEPGAFGLTAEWLVHDGELVPSAIVLSHDEQRERLRQGCPQAVPLSHVVGDPCMDEIQASLPFRSEYRASFGLRPGQKLLLLTSTWGRRSLLGGAADVVGRALAELPRDEFRVVAAVHPNAWYGHGGWQIRSWLEPHVRAGLILPEPASDTWKAALCAADAFLGDHGSLTLYAAGRGLPGLLAAFDDGSVAAGSPMARLGALLPRVRSSAPLAGQLAAALRDQPGSPDLTGISQLVTSRPGQALARLRRLCYRTLDLDEPPRPVVPRPVRLPPPPADARRSPLEQPVFAEARVTGHDSTGRVTVSVRRYPAEPQTTGNQAHLRDAQVVVDEGEPDPRWANVADVVVSRGSRPGDLFGRHAGCSVVVEPTSRAACRLRLRDGTGHHARWTTRPWWATPAVAAAVIGACLARSGNGWEGEVAVRAGDELPLGVLFLRRTTREPDPKSPGPDLRIDH
ncbi:hypothetical protein U9R90_04485 [Streptomyces sp. E11-3]|uniref:hypothetical protein n=1 Tax=Streptomyces sp. E11-3 TaxID=3110112 RepID=UPI00397EC3B6